jgi:hypothetical protein
MKQMTFVFLAADTDLKGARMAWTSIGFRFNLTASWTLSTIQFMYFKQEQKPHVSSHKIVWLVSWGKKLPALPTNVPIPLKSCFIYNPQWETPLLVCCKTTCKFVEPSDIIQPLKDCAHGANVFHHIMPLGVNEWPCRIIISFLCVCYRLYETHTPLVFQTCANSSKSIPGQELHAFPVHQRQ